jgi:iron complex outermembrane recepter protein
MSRKNARIAAAIRAAIAATPGLATPAFAQEAPPASELQEVTVTGQRFRDQDQTTATGLALQLIDTPQSLSVISQDMLKATESRNAYDAFDFIPGVSQTGQGYGGERVAIRGQALSQPRINGINFETPELVDGYALERIEVVRGPATVLYGVTAGFGGELNQFLKRPQAEFHLDFGAEFGDFARHRYQADITGPIPGTDDHLKARFVTAYTTEGMAQDLVVPPRNLDRLITGAVSWEFAHESNLSLYYYQQNRNFDPYDGCTMGLDASSNTLYVPLQVPVEHWYCNDPRHSAGTGDDEFAMATIDHTFENSWTVTANVARGRSNRTLDYAYAFGPAGAYGLAPTDVYLYAYRNQTASNVVTANGSLGGKFDLWERTQQFFAALQYQTYERHQYHWASEGLGTLNMFQDGGKGILSDGTPIPPWSLNDYVSDRNAYYRNLLGSFQLLLSLPARFDLLGGLLVQHSTLESQNYQVGKVSPVSSATETDTLGRFAVTYGLTANEGNLLKEAKAYATWSEGIEPNVGLFDSNGIALTAPQKMQSYEVGLKSAWLERHALDADIALFHSYVTNVPSSVFGKTGTSAGSGFSSVLSGKNTYDGAEVEVLGEVAPGWNVSLAYTYFKTKIEQPLFSYDLRVANVPKQQASFVTSYEFRQGPLRGLSGGFSVVGKYDSPLVDSASTIFAGNYDPHNQLFVSQTRWDFRLAYKRYEGALKGLELYGNIYNAFGSRFFYSINGTPAFTDTVARPRTITFGINYRY